MRRKRSDQAPEERLGAWRYFAATDGGDYSVRMRACLVSGSLSIICKKFSLTDDDKTASGVDRQGRSDSEGMTYHAAAGID